MIENTNFGGIGYGAIYQRVPQTRFGFGYNLGGSRSVKIAPEFAIVFPAFGNVPANVADQLGYGERQGADSSRPGLQGRVVLQWQLDKAEGVVPAEFIVSYETCSTHCDRDCGECSGAVQIRVSFRRRSE